MQTYTELTPPTAVTYAISLSFLDATSNNLVLARTSLLQIFELKSTVTEAVKTEPDDTALTLQRTNTGDGGGAFLEGELSLQKTEDTSKLVLVREYNLSGTIIGLAQVKLEKTKSGGNAILVAFADAKLSLIEWDPASGGISTISIHFYEGEGLNLTPWAPERGRDHAYLAVDPRSRCAALKFGARQLAILPFRQSEDELADDYDPDLDGPREESQAKRAAADGSSSLSQTPYGSSFVLPLTGLDPSLIHAIHLDFLYEYRQPTLGVLSASKAPSNALLPERKDPLTYSVFTLDIDQRESTNILQVSGLPYDLYRVVPLPLPIGGTLLLGHNDLVHIDQGGKATAIAVNSFARQNSAFPMADHADLALRLEGCRLQQLGPESLDKLLVMNSGDLALLSFKMDGRSVSSLSIERIPDEKGGSPLSAAASCSVFLGRNKAFIGSEDADSIVLGWTRKASHFSRKRSHADMLGGEPDEEIGEGEMEDGDDDLYSTGASLSRQVTQSGPSQHTPASNYTFRVHDSLPNLAPMRDIAFRAPKKRSESGAVASSSTEVIVPSGKGTTGGVAVMNTHLVPDLVHTSQIPAAQGIWTVHVKKMPPKGIKAEPQNDLEGKIAADADHDQFLIASRTTSENDELSDIYEVGPDGIRESAKGEFEPGAGATIEVGTLAEGSRIVQVLKSEIRAFDAEWGLAQMIPMEDEAAGTELSILAASFCDPYVLVLRDDSSVIILRYDESGDIVEVPGGSAIKEKKWLSGCLYQSTLANKPTFACLLSAEGGLSIFSVLDLDTPAWATEGVNLLPSTITKNFTSRRAAARDALSEVLVADIGDSVDAAPHLILRTGMEDLAVYKAYYFPAAETGQDFTENLRWHKICQPRLTVYSDETATEPARLHMLKRLPNISGYQAVCLTGTSPSILLKEASTVPRLIPIQSEALRGITSFNAEKCDRGFAVVHASGLFQVCQLPKYHHYGTTGWPTRKINLGQQADALSYFPRDDLIAVGVSSRATFKLPDDDYHHEWNRETTSFLPETDHGSIKVFDAESWNVIYEHDLDPSEVVLTIQTLDLEISEVTHKRKPHIVVGTAVTRGEDLRTTGRLYVFDVVSVVPQPDRPETKRKIKLVVREESPGALTAITSAGVQGFLLAAHGQKCLVRGLKEDNTLPPVAFMDAQCYVSVAKSLPNTGLLLLGDAIRGLWLVGYTEEPYKMMLFGKTRTNLEVVAADFLPFDRQLFIVIADGDCNIHVMQFDPNHPKALSGQRLIHRSSFHVGHMATSMTLVPRDALRSDVTTHSPELSNGDVSNSLGDVHHQILVTTQSGSLGLVTALDEQTYRRLTALQTYLYNNVDHPCGLNPRAYRAADSEGLSARGIVDGTACARGWADLSSRGRAEACGKVGSEAWTIRGDMEKIMGGVSFLSNAI